MKVYVRHGGGELMFPSFKDFQSMYRLKFIAPDDLVRRETSDRWVPAKDLPELRALHLYDRPAAGRWVGTAFWLMLGLVALAVALQMVWVLASRPAP